MFSLTFYTSTARSCLAQTVSDSYPPVVCLALQTYRKRQKQIGRQTLSSGAALGLSFMKYRYYFPLYTPCEVQFDETVIFFTEHSIKLYTVVDGTGLFPLRFIAFFSTIKQCILFGFFECFPFSVISLHMELNQNVMSFAAVITLSTFGSVKQIKVHLSCIHICQHYYYYYFFLQAGLQNVCPVEKDTHFFHFFQVV